MTIKPAPFYVVNQLIYRFPYSILISILLMIVLSVPIAVAYPVYMYTKFGIDTKMPTSLLFWGGLFLGAFILSYVKNYIDDLLYIKNTTLSNDDNKITLDAGGFHSVNLTYPLEKVSTIQASQSLIERIFNLSTLILSGEFNENVTVKGFQYSDAKRFAADTLKQ